MSAAGVICVPLTDAEGAGSYKATVTAGVRDVAGNRLSTAKWWSFKVR